MNIGHNQTLGEDLIKDLIVEWLGLCCGTMGLLSILFDFMKLNMTWDILCYKYYIEI
jgi:hypothetical protein